MSEMVSVQLGFKPNSQALPRWIHMEKLTDLPQITQLLWAEVGPGSLKPEFLSSAQSGTGGNNMSRVTYEQVKPCKSSPEHAVVSASKANSLPEMASAQRRLLPTLHRPRPDFIPAAWL